MNPKMTRKFQIDGKNKRSLDIDLLGFLKHGIEIRKSMSCHSLLFVFYPRICLSACLFIKTLKSYGVGNIHSFNKLKIRSKVVSITTTKSVSFIQYIQLAGD